MHYKFDQKFFDDYDLLIPRNDRYIFTSFWRLGKKDIQRMMLDDSTKAIDFIWASLCFSFVSKLIYSFSRIDYIYVSDYFERKYDCDGIFSKLYQFPLKNMTDEVFNHLPESIRENVITHSEENMKSYAEFFYSILQNIDIHLVGVESFQIIYKFKNDWFFLEEFSTDPRSLSNSFLQHMIQQLNQQ